MDSGNGKVNPKVYFTMCFSTDKDTEKLLNQIKGEFQKLGGIFLRLKNLNAFDPKPTTVLYQVLNKNNLVPINNEFQDIILEARRLELQADQFYQYACTPIPETAVGLNVRKLPSRTYRCSTTGPTG